jgi:hypothetical protein
VPKSPSRSRLVANATAVAVVGASTAVLLMSPVAAPQAAAAAAPGSTQRASVTDADGQSELGGSSSAMSADGNHVVFVSRSWLDTTINPGQQQNVFVRDLRTGRTSMISRGRPGLPPPSTPSTPQPPRFGPAKVLDLGAPAKQAVQPSPVEVPADGDSFNPAVSANGRYVAFATIADNIVDNASGGSKIVVCDRDPGNTGQFDVDRPGQPRYACFGASGRIGSSTFASEPKLSADAGRIVWQETTNGEGLFARLKTAVLRVNGVIGPPGQDGIRSVSSQIGDNDFIIVDDQFDPAISGDGNHIVMHGTYRRNCDCENDRFHAIVSHDVRTGTVTRVDFDGLNDGAPDPVSHNVDEFVMRPTVSFDGTVIAFVAEQFFFDDSRGRVSRFDQPNVYVVKVDYAKVGREVVDTDLVSRNNAGDLANGERPTLSADGRYLAFVTDSLRMHDGTDGPQVQNSCINPLPDVIGLAGGRMLNLAAALPPERPNQRTNCQVVVRDLILDQARLVNEDSRLPGTLVSPNQAGNAGDGNTVPHRARSSAPSLSSDGGRVAFDSDASNLIPNDTNKTTDVFVRTLEPTLQADELNFGSVEVGQSATRTVQVAEAGAGPLFVQSVAVGGVNAADFAITGQTCQGQTLHQTGTCAVTVRFTPGAEGARAGLLTFVIRGGRRATVNLTGTGTVQPPPPGPAEFANDPISLNFGPRLLLSNGPELAVTVSNNGESPMTISGVTVVGTNPADYTISSNGCATVAPKATCKVSVKFSPKLPGNRTANLQFADNAPGGPHLVGLNGSGNQPSLTVSPGVATPGQVVTVNGKDFPPGKPVAVKFDGRIGQSIVVAAADGTFRAPLLIFPKSRPENRTVLGVVDGFTDPLARGTLLIVFPSVSPAEFVVRG